MKKLILFSLLIFPLFLFSQSNREPRVAAIPVTENKPVEVKRAAYPTPENKVLIDSLMKFSAIDKYFEDFCRDTILSSAKKFGWDSAKTKEKLNKIDFAAFKEYTIYNTFGNTSKAELESKIYFFQSLKPKDIRSQGIRLLEQNDMILRNLNLFIKHYL